MKQRSDVEAAHARGMGDGDGFKGEDVGDEKNRFLNLFRYKEVGSIMAKLDTNLKKFSKIYPKEAIRMEHIAKVQLPQMDSESFLKSMNLQEMDQLIIYGVGNGEVISFLEDWLKNKDDRLLIFIEDNLGILKAFLDSEMGSKSLKNEKIQLHYYQKNEENENLFHRLMWQGWEKQCQLLKDPRYDRDSYQTFTDHFNYDRDRIKWFAHEMKHFGVGYFINFYSNIRYLPESFDGLDCFGKAKGMPAIIVGAGPSLNKNGDLLKSVADKALIFAGGSSIALVKELGVVPDFGAGVDPNSAQCSRLRQYGKIDFPYFYRLRVNHEALELVEKKIFIPGAGLYATPSWLQKRLNIQDLDIDEGHNIIHFMTNIAYLMGCNPIIYVGLDLAFTDGAMYAKGIEWPSKIPQDSTEGIDIYGNPVVTRWMWLKESFWLSQFVKEQSDISYINATEGGIGIPGVPNEKLTDVLAHLKVKVNKNFEFKKLNCTKDQIEESVQILTESLNRIDPILDEMVRFYDKMDPKQNISLNYPEEAFFALKLIDEPAFEAILATFDTFLLQFMNSSPHFYLIQRDGLKSKYIKKLIEAQKQRIYFLKQVIKIQHEMIKKYFLLRVEAPDEVSNF